MQLGKLPHWLSRSVYFWGFILIVGVTALTRLYQLSGVPRSLSLDEVAIGYNGYAISHTGRDEWLKVLPVSFKSFSDYKAPLAIYLNGLFTLLLGLEPGVVRLPSALAGVVGVAMIMLVTRELALVLGLQKDHLRLPEWLALGSGIILSTTPWHFHFTRIAFESGIALALLLTAFYLFLKFVQSSQLKWLLGSSAFFAATLYAYHSPKVMVPLLLIVIWGFWKKKLWATKKNVILAAVFGGLLLAPLALDTLFGSGSERLNQVTIHANSPTEFVQIIAHNYTDHFSLDFLVKGKTDSYRHGDGVWGVLLLPSLVASLIGALTLVLTSTSNERRFLLFSFLWVVIGLVPAALGTDTPHANRSLLALPGFIWLAVMGVKTGAEVLERTKWAKSVVGSHHETQILAKSFVGTMILLQSLLFISYQRNYHTVYAQLTDDDFQAGYFELFATLKKYEDNPQIQQIKISNRFGSSYIYALFTKKMDPFIYNFGGLSRYLLVSEVKPDTLLEPNMVIVATKLDDMPFAEAEEVITDQHGNLRFAIFVTEVN